MFAPRSSRILQHLAVGATAAFATAALHLGIVTWRRDVLGQFSWLWSSRDIIWMVPAGYVLVFATIALPLGVLAALLPKGLSVRTTTWVWVTTVLFSVGLLFPRVHSAALLALALGVGFQLARLASRRPAQAVWTITRAGIALAVMFALLIAAFELRRFMSARRTLAVRAQASSDAPNILLLVWDTARAKNFSLYGHSRPTTPFLDSLARGAVVFDHAFSAAPWTLPSHATMFTGQYASTQSGDFVSPMDDAHRTLAEELRDHGYATGGFVANLEYASYPTGLHRGFTSYEDYPITLGRVLVSTTLTQSHSILGAFREAWENRWYGGAVRQLLRFNLRPIGGRFQWPSRRRGVEVTDGFLRWQARTPRPFFAFLNYMEAHDVQRAPLRDRFNGGATQSDKYDGALLSLDSELARVTRELDARGELSRTIIIVTSDHGEQFGEHGLSGHSNSLYLELLHVPLVILAPGHPAAGSRVSAAVSLRDLPATILSLAGIMETSLPGTKLLTRDGELRSSLLPSPAIAEVSRGINVQPPSRTYYGDLTAVIDDSLHVIRDGTGEYNVFAYRRDPGEAGDLARDPRIAQMARARIDSVVRQFGLRPPNVGSRRRRRGAP